MAEPDGRKGRILAAAEKLFRHYGPQKTSIADIARAASCAVGSVYLDFPSKEAILAEIAARRQAAVAQAMRAAGRGASTPPARLGAMLEARTVALFRLAAEGAHAGDLVRCSEEGEGCQPESDEPDVKRAAREAPFFGWGFGAPVREVLVEVVRDGVATGAFDGGVSPETVVAVVERAFATLSPPWIFRQTEADALRATRALAAMLLHGMLARPPVPRGARRTSIHVRVRRSS